MAFTDHIQVFPMVEVGEPVNGAARANKRSAQLSGASSEAITAGMGVCRSSSAIGNYQPLVILPTETGEFAGIVPADAIPSAEEAALAGETSGQVRPGKVFAVGVASNEGSQWRVPLPAGTSTAGAPAYLIFSGANQGKWAISDLGVQPVYLGEVTSAGAGAIGFYSTIGGTQGVTLSVTSVSAAVDSAALVALWNANAFYSAYGVATVGGTNDIVITGNAYTAISLTDASGGGNSIAFSTTTALTAPTARAITGARFRVAASTNTIVELT